MKYIIAIMLGVLCLLSCSSNEEQMESVSIHDEIPLNTISIETAPEISWDMKQPCRIIYSQGGANDTVHARIKCRGGISSKYPKHSYAVEFDYPFALFGIAEDDDWIFNAGYIDRTFLRHKLSYDMFRSFDEVNRAAKSSYAEIYLNGNYEGLYVIMEEVNAGMLELDKQDTEAVVFKGPPIFYKNRLEYTQEADNYYQQKYPKIDKRDKSAEMDAIHDFLFNATEAEFAKGIWSFFDKQSVLDWHIILLISNNDDGLYKNFYLYKRNKDERYKIAIWDYDHSFGRDGDGSLNMLERNVKPEKIILFDRLMRSSELDYKSDLKHRWNALKAEGNIDFSTFRSMVDMNSETLRPYLKKNYERWPITSDWYPDTNDFNEELEIMVDYYQRRIPQINQYFESL